VYPKRALTIPSGTIKHAQLAAITHNREIIARYRSQAQTPGEFSPSLDFSSLPLHQLLIGTHTIPILNRAPMKLKHCRIDLFAFFLFFFVLFKSRGTGFVSSISFVFGIRNLDSGSHPLDLFQSLSHTGHQCQSHVNEGVSKATSHQSSIFCSRCITRPRNSAERPDLSTRRSNTHCLQTQKSHYFILSHSHLRDTLHCPDNLGD
jgi:hypothetical protein